MQDDSLDKIVSPSLQHNVDAIKLKGTGEKKREKEIPPKSKGRFHKAKKIYFSIYQQKMTGYSAGLQSYIFREEIRFISFYSRIFQVSLNLSSESSQVYPAIMRIF